VHLVTQVLQGVCSSFNRVICWVALLGVASGFVFAQPTPAGDVNGYWSHLRETPAHKLTAERWVRPLKSELFKLDEAKVRARLAKVRRAELSLADSVGDEVVLPMPDGSTARFKVVDSPVMAPELAARFPEIRTYAGRGVDDPSATVFMDLTPAGLHAQVLSPQGAVYVDPAYRGDSQHYVSYFKKDYQKLFDGWSCKLVDRGVVPRDAEQFAAATVLSKTQSGPQLLKYRLAVAATGEYTAFHGGTVQLGLAAVVTAINRVNQVYISELSVRMELVANNDLLIYTSAGADPYTNNDGVTMLDENQTNINAVIGGGNYDIGHVFSTGGGGIASWQSVCNGTRKAKGVTGLPSPIGDAFYIDYVAHEIGHQFGGDHTFNSETGECGRGNREGIAAFEPGSGSTIMAYAGICSPNNLQNNSDPYFHAGSLDQIQSFLNGTGGGCAVNQATGNSAPTVNGGPDLAIPASTPFEMTASGSDPNGNPLAFCWEEMDLGPSAALTAADDGEIPLFRTFNPSTNVTRFFPRLSSVLANTNWNQEKLPAVGRVMALRVTARDGLGGVADDDVQLTVVGGTGPFRVTSPNTSVSWSGSRTVTWNVAGTTGAPINALGVNIYLSTDGGLTFPFLLATNVPNSGSANIVLPNVTSSTARIKIRGAGNVFYDVSDVNFTVQPGVAVPIIQSFGYSLVSENCLPKNGSIDPYEAVTVDWKLFNSGNAPTTNLTATLQTGGGVYFPSGPRDYGVIPPGGTVTQQFSFVPAANCGGAVTGILQLADGAAALGTAAQLFPLGAPGWVVATQSFNNFSAVPISDLTGFSDPYPTTVAVSGLGSSASKVTVQLYGLQHTYPDDLGVSVQSPGGQGKVLMTACGAGFDLFGVNLSFDDSAGASLPDASQINPGVYLPTDRDSRYSLPSPAPSAPFASTINQLGNSPNGTWSLYIYDFFDGDDGSLASGWGVTIVSSNYVLDCCDTLPPVGYSSVTYSNARVLVLWQSLPGVNYQVQTRTDLTVGTWENLGVPIPGTGAMLGTNEPAGAGPMRFYRVQAVP